MNKVLIGVDLGGTNMRAGLVEDGLILNVSAAPVPVSDNWKIVMDKLIKTIADVITPEVDGIGIGVPGVVNAKTGVVYDLQNIPSWKEVAVGEILSNHFKMPVHVNNDANCFAVGERFYGAGQNFDDFVGLITGTGLGAGIIKWGHLLPDQNCGAGEFGMIPYLDHNYENYCSGQFFSYKAGLDGAEVALRATNGDKTALSLFAEYGKHLANAIKSIIFAIDPAAIIIGGSVSRSFSFYENVMREELAKFPYSGVVEKLVIKPSEMPEIAILGAAALNFNKQQLFDNNYKYA